MNYEAINNKHKAFESIRVDTLMISLHRHVHIMCSSSKVYVSSTYQLERALHLHYSVAS